MKKVNGGVLLLLFLSGVAFASKDYVIGPGGRHYQLDSDVKALPNSKESVLVRAKVTPKVPLAQEEFDLRWPDGGDLVNFGFSTHEPTPATGDSIGQWMVPLAAATVKKLMLYNVNFEGTFELCLYESNYSGEVETASQANAAGWIGLYLDSNGEQCESGDDCTWSPGDNADFTDPLLGAEIWPGLGIGCFSVELDGEEGWNEIDMVSVGYADVEEDFFIAGIATRDAGWGIGGLNGPVTPYHGFKYYWEEDSGTSGNWGWHIRTYGWELYAIVEYTEDIPPFIDDVTELLTTLDPDVAREVTAKITDFDPTGAGNEGVASATLWWSVNDGTADSETMTAETDTTYSAEIPANVAEPGDDVEYWITAEDEGGLEAEGVHYGYSIYDPDPDANFVYLFDGLSGSGYPSLYYFYDAYGVCTWCDLGTADLWAYGAASADFFDLYETVFEITTGGPLYGNAEEAKAWLDDGGKNYMLAGDEILGGWYGWPGEPVGIDTADGGENDATPFFAYLGVDTYYGDINYAGDATLPSEVSAVEDDDLSGDLYDGVVANDVELLYDPFYEVGASNWLDGMGVDATVTTAMTSMPRGGSGYDSTTALAIGIYKEDTSLDNKVVFLAFDPLSLNSDPYVWWGARPEAPHWQAMEWFGIFDMAVGDEVAQIPSKFGLHQNYPNPFNPVTNIRFDLPSDGQMTLTVYNMLGQKVTTLVNEVRNAGSHTVMWDGTTDAGIEVGTGVYLYRIDAGDFTATKKMILLK